MGAASKKIISDNVGKKILNAFRSITGTAAATIADEEANRILTNDTGDLIATEASAALASLSNQIANKADKASPTFTGTPAAPTASAGTNTTQIATTAFVQNAVTSAKVIIVDVAASENTSTTVTNAAITADHVPLNDVVSGAGADVEVTTAAGSVTIECTAGIPAFRLILGLPQ